MGSRMVAHLISAGHDVIVWNRSTATSMQPWRSAPGGGDHAVPDAPK